LVFEVVFFFVSLTVLGLWLLARDEAEVWRGAWRARRVRQLLRTFDGKELARAENVLGPASEIVNGSRGRRLYVWKDPVARGIPSAASLLIITLTVDGAGIVTHVAWELR